jgi:hypothetical protein
MTPKELLVNTLQIIMREDRNYEIRNMQVLRALYLATLCGYDAGVRIDPAEPEWPVAYIELPNVGQVSWHIPQHPYVWDGHSTPEKFERIRAFCGGINATQKG